MDTGVDEAGCGLVTYIKAVPLLSGAWGCIGVFGAVNGERFGAGSTMGVSGGGSLGNGA